MARWMLQEMGDQARTTVLSVMSRGSRAQQGSGQPPWCVLGAPGPLLPPTPLLLCMGLDQSPELSDAT